MELACQLNVSSGRARVGDRQLERKNREPIRFRKSGIYEVFSAELIRAFREIVTRTAEVSDRGSGL